MRFENAFLRAAQGDRITHIADRGSAVADEMEDMRAACKLCGLVLYVQLAGPIGDRVRALLRWMEDVVTQFESGALEVTLPLHLQQTLREIGEELRDNAEDELDRLALQRIRRMLRVGAASKRDQWALRRVVDMVEVDGFEDPGRYGEGMRDLSSSVNDHYDPVPIDAVAAGEMRQVLVEFT